jgi:hypothetical protein
MAIMNRLALQTATIAAPAARPGGTAADVPVADCADRLAREVIICALSFVLTRAERSGYRQGQSVAFGRHGDALVPGGE